VLDLLLEQLREGVVHVYLLEGSCQNVRNVLCT